MPEQAGPSVAYHEAADFSFGLRRFRAKPGTSTARLLAFLEITRETPEEVGHSPVPSSE